MYKKIFILNGTQWDKKKELILRVLEKLEWYWDMAPWFLVIVEKTWDEKIIDELLKLIQIGIKSIKDKRVRTKIANRIKELQKEWDLTQEIEKEEAEKMLDEFISNIKD